MILIDLLIDDTVPNYFVKVVWIQVFYYKITIFPLSLKKISWGHPLGLHNFLKNFNERDRCVLFSLFLTLYLTGG